MSVTPQGCVVAVVSFILAVVCTPALLEATPPKNKRPNEGAAQTVTVPAQACLWFAWATDKELGTADAPQGPFDEFAPDYRPVAIDVPAGATKLTVSAVGIWSHKDPRSGPDGIREAMSLKTPDYKSKSFRGTGAIRDVKAPLNTLVGMWQIGNVVPSEANSVVPFVIGSEMKDVKVPVRAQKLYLGFHDGQEWSDNSGHVKATIRWEIPRRVVTVPATACLWYAWATDGELGNAENGRGPFEESVAHRPVSIAVPPGVSTVSITATGNWRHDPADNTASNPDGKSNDSRKLERPGYRGPAVRGSQAIKDIETNMNKLVGLWQIGQRVPSKPNSVVPIEIGSNYCDRKVPKGATRLYLGMHDGYEWSNNSGKVKAEIIWDAHPALSTTRSPDDKSASR